MWVLTRAGGKANKNFKKAKDFINFIGKACKCTFAPMGALPLYGEYLEYLKVINVRNKSCDMSKLQKVQSIFKIDTILI